MNVKRVYKSLTIIGTIASLSSITVALMFDFGKGSIVGVREVLLALLAGSICPLGLVIFPFVNRKNAEYHYQCGAIALDRRNYDHAIKCYTKALLFCPTDARCYYNRSGAYFLDQNYEMAIKDMDRAIEIDPDYYYIATVSLYNLLKEVVKNKAV